MCGGAAIPYTQNGLALGFGSAWVVCTPQRRVERVTGGKVVATVALPEEPWAIAAGEGAVWALARDGSTVYRLFYYYAEGRQRTVQFETEDDAR